MEQLLKLIIKTQETYKTGAWVFSFPEAKSGEVTFYVDADRNIPVSGFADLKSLGLG